MKDKKQQNSTKVEKKDYNYWLKKVAIYPQELEYVPTKYKTAELCKTAVKHSGWSLEHVPAELKTPELCELAVNNFGMALEFVPEGLRSSALCELAVEDYGKNNKFKR